MNKRFVATASVVVVFSFLLTAVGPALHLILMLLQVTLALVHSPWKTRVHLHCGPAAAGQERGLGDSRAKL